MHKNRTHNEKIAFNMHNEKFIKTLRKVFDELEDHNFIVVNHDLNINTVNSKKNGVVYYFSRNLYHDMLDVQISFKKIGDTNLSVIRDFIYESLDKHHLPYKKSNSQDRCVTVKRSEYLEMLYSFDQL